MALEFPLLKERGLVVVSNRGPVSHHLASDGSVSARRSAGGLVSAFLPLARLFPFTWIAAAVTSADRVVARRTPLSVLQFSPLSHPIALRLVQMPRPVFHRFYDLVANSLLWPLHHYLWSPGKLPEAVASLYTAWSQGYVPANHAFARAIVELAEKSATQPVILLQDYHLFLVAALLRPQLPQALISHFLHIPWPGPRYWMMLPGVIREAIFKGLGNCDVVGLQTPKDVRNLMDTWELSQKGAVLDKERGVVITPEERLVTVKAYPISVDVPNLEDMAQRPEVRSYRQALRPTGQEKLIVRVDRLDPMKNIVAGFLAYEQLLAEHPELREKVQFHALLVPSRQGVAAYRRYRKEVERVVEQVNLKYGGSQWQPIVAYIEESYERAIALLQEYDVLVVNSLIDGMNLVAKEGCVVNERNGVIVLSMTAGCYSELAEGVLPIGPADIDCLKEAYYRALAMGTAERAERASLLRRTVRQRDITHWLGAQLKDLEALAQSRS